jgi:hypothetical protein
MFAPIILFVLAGVFEHVVKGQHDPDARFMLLIYGAVSCLILVAGLVLGILALVLAFTKPGGRTPVILTSGAGFTLTALFLAIFVPNFVRGRERAIAERKTLEDVRLMSRQLQKDSLKTFDPGHSADVSALKQSVDKAARETTGENAAYMKVLSADLQKFQNVQAAYKEAIRQLTDAHVMRTSDLTGREQLKTREAIVQKFLDVNVILEAFVKNHEQILHDELVGEHIPETGIASAIASFRKSSADQMPLVLEIRQTDRRMGNAMLQSLDLLDADWGQWHYDAAKTKLIFQNTATLQKYNSAIREINSAQADQAVSQQKLKAVMAQKLSMHSDS